MSRFVSGGKILERMETILFEMTVVEEKAIHFSKDLLYM